MGRCGIWALAMEARSSKALCDARNADRGSEARPRTENCSSPCVAGTQAGRWPTELEAYPIRSAINPKALLPDRDVDSNKLLRDHDGGLWIGTHQRGSSMCITAEPMYLRNLMASRATSSSAFSRIAKAMSGSPPLEVSTGFETSPSPRFQSNKVCPVTLAGQCSLRRMAAYGLPLAMV